MRHPTQPVVRTRRLIARTVVAACVFAMSACSSSKSATPTGPNAASLVVTILAPLAATPSVTITGPGDYSKIVHTTTTLSGLAPGQYNVAAAPATTSNHIVRELFTATVTRSQVLLVGDDTGSVNVSYVVTGGTGGLWVLNSASSNLARYSAEQLAATTITTADSPTFGAFDAAGNFYVMFSATRVLAAYAPKDLASSGTPTPGASTPPGFGFGAFGAIAFDAAGALWVVRDSSLLKFPTDQLMGDDPRATVILTLSLGSLSGVTGLAFDSAGNLWVGSSAGAVVELRPGQLTASGNPAPAVTLTGLSPVAWIAFDVTGNLWTPSVNDGAVNEYAGSALKQSGVVTPILHITGLHGPKGVAFDESGNLWIANKSSDELVEFGAAHLVSGGATLTANVTVKLPANSAPEWIAFDPHPLALPLKP